MTRVAAKTTVDQKLEVYEVASLMKASGLPADFITAAVQYAEEYEGGYDLLMLWRDAGDDKDAAEEREQIVADLQALLDEWTEQRPGVEEKPYIRFDALKTVAAKIAAFKDELRRKVDAWGGVSQLARATGIPQPSLSRFFNSAAMPRRTTLYKIARALDLSETEITTDWIR